VYSFEHKDHCTEIRLRYDMDSNMPERLLRPYCEFDTAIILYPFSSPGLGLNPNGYVDYCTIEK
jgi:hypothetical protein